MPHASWIPEAHCAVAQSLAVLRDSWDLLIVRDLARGHLRFEQLASELGISRKVLTERLRRLEEHGLIQRRAYQEAPTRHEYRLTPPGSALIPVLVALQDWGDRWLLGDGEATGLATPGTEARLHELIGVTVPEIELPATTGGSLDVVDPSRTTILFGYPMTVLGSAPDGWSRIPGAAGCTLENRLFRDRYPEIIEKNLALRGVSTQRPDEQRAFAFAEGVEFALLSDVELMLTAALRLPTFRAAEMPRLRRFILIVGADRTIRSALFPIGDIPAAIDWALAEARRE
jgi:DNA-binding HxlR family transcriptional regulator/peroxiredoxin